MTLEERYNKLRAACLDIVGAGDDLPMLKGVRDALDPYIFDQNDDAGVCAKLLDALIETHGSKQ
jgi:hypothetical protein